MKPVFFAFLFFCQASLFAQSLQGTILFSRTRNNADSLFALKQDGSMEYITNGFRPRISRKGRLILFIRNLSNPGSSFGASMWVRNLETQQESLLLTNNDYLDYYDFSPSDREIVYSQQCNMYKMNTNGTNAYTYLGCTPCNCYSDNPKVRLSDSLLAYHNVFFGLYTVNYNGSQPTKIPNTNPGDLYPVWSPDGQWLAFARSTSGGFYVPNDLFKIRPNGSDSTRLTQFSAADTLVSDPVWSKDGQFIFVIGRIAGQPGVHRIDAYGSGQRTLIHLFPPQISIMRYTLGIADSIPSVFTAVRSTGLEPALALFPHPVKEQFEISGLEVGTPYQLFSLDGRLVKAATYHGYVQAADLAPGMYALVIAGKQKSIRLLKE